MVGVALGILVVVVVVDVCLAQGGARIEEHC
jgi:hypothetical protein